MDDINRWQDRKIRVFPKLEFHVVFPLCLLAGFLTALVATFPGRHDGPNDSELVTPSQVQEAVDVCELFEFRPVVVHNYRGYNTVTCIASNGAHYQPHNLRGLRELD